MKYTYNVKKSLVLLLAVTLTLLLCACSRNVSNPGTPTVSTPVSDKPSARVSNTPTASTAPAPTAPSSQTPSSPVVSNTPVVSDPPTTSGNTPNSPTPQTATTTPSTPTATGTPSNGGPAKILTFKVNASMPIYQCAVTVSDNGEVTKIVITDAGSGALVQTITPPDNAGFAKSALYFADVTFDGNLDILLPLERSAHYVTFDAYVWDGASKQFIEVPSFQDIWNPAIDSSEERILSKDSSSQITSYAIFACINNNQFYAGPSFSWQPASLDLDPPANADNLMHCTEMAGSLAIVNDFYVLTDGYGGVDMNDAQIKPYFVPGSYWDLGGQKWQCTFYNELK